MRPRQIDTSGGVSDYLDLTNLPYYNVKSSTYGAVGDGVTDDATAIQAAVTACGAAGGGTVFFPAGTYLIGTKITMSYANVTLKGVGRKNSIILASGNGVGVLFVGTQVPTTNVEAIVLQEMGFKCTASSTQVCVDVYGVSRFMAILCDFYRGTVALQLRHADQTTLFHNEYRVTGSTAIALNLIQDQTDDVTTGEIIGGLLDVTGTGGSTCLKFSDSTGGSANANEFNNLFFCGLKFDGNSAAATTGVLGQAGTRNVNFFNCELKNFKSYSIDLKTAAVTTYNNRMNFKACKLLGISTSFPLAHFYIAEQTGAKTFISIEDSQMSNATTGVLIGNTGTKSPKIRVSNIESSNLTNWIESDDNTVTPTIAVGMSNIGGSVTNKIGTNLNGASALWDSIGTRDTTFLAKVTYPSATFTSPTLVTPALGTPSSGVLTNCTGLPAAGGGTGQSTYAKGDTLVSPGSNTLNKLAVGSDGKIRIASAAQTNGMAWFQPNGRLKTATSTWIGVPQFNTISSKTLTLGRIYLAPFYVDRTMSFDHIGFATIIVTTVSYKVGIYADAGTSAAPTGTVIANSTATSAALTTASVTAQSLALGGTLTLEPGMYWFAVLCDTSSGTFNAVSATAMAQFLGTTDLTVGSASDMYVTGTYASGLVDLTGATLVRTVGGSFPYGALQST